MNNCEYQNKNGHCTLNECMYGDFLEYDDSRFGTGRFCYATCEEFKKAKELKGQKNGR